MMYLEVANGANRRHPAWECIELDANPRTFWTSDFRIFQIFRALATILDRILDRAIASFGAQVDVTDASF